MPIDVKVNYDFKALDGLSSGWNEVWYMAADNINAALELAEEYVLPRRKLLAPSYALTGVRVSDEAILRDSLAVSYSLSQSQGLYKEAPSEWTTQDDEQSWDGLKVRLEAGSLHRRSLALRGLPRSVVRGNGLYDPTPKWITLFNQWKANVIGPPAFRIRTQTAAAATFPTAVAVGATKKYLSFTFTGGAPAGYTAGKIVSVKGIDSASPVNHKWRIRYVIGDTIYLFPQRRTIYGTPTNTGFLQLISIAYADITEAIPQRGTKRNTGRPLDQQVGRSRARQT